MYYACLLLYLEGKQERGAGGTVGYKRAFNGIHDAKIPKPKIAPRPCLYG